MGEETYGEKQLMEVKKEFVRVVEERQKLKEDINKRYKVREVCFVLSETFA